MFGTIHLSVCVCESYVVHHLVSTGLCCAPSACVVHHQPLVCTMVQKGDLCLSDEVVAPDIFHFLVGHKEHAKMDTFCPYLMGHKNIKRTLYRELFFGGTKSLWCSTLG